MKNYLVIYHYHTCDDVGFGDIEITSNSPFDFEFVKIIRQEIVERISSEQNCEVSVVILNIIKLDE